MEKCGWNIPWIREVCSGEPEEVWDDGLQGHGHTYCKAMDTPMASNLKLLSDASSELVDATMYHQMIGFLMYLTNKRPYIFFAVNNLSLLFTDPRHVHLIVAKHILRYLRSTVDYGLKYELN